MRMLMLRLRLLIADENQKKLLILKALIVELRKFLTTNESAESGGTKMAFLLFFTRFIDCMKAVHLLTNSGLSRQASMVNRHALECTVYMGAVASLPNMRTAILTQEVYQRMNLRTGIVKMGIISHAEKLLMDEESAKDIRDHQNELDALSQHISQIKADRGWPKTNTANELSINELALCSEIFDIFPKLHGFLNMSVHVFFGQLYDDHVKEVDGEERIHHDVISNWIQPVNDAVVLIGAVFYQAHKLFGTSLHTSTDAALITKFWP